MPEFPGEVQQVSNFFKGRQEIRKARVEYKPRAIQAGILYGLETLVPSEVKASAILHNPDRMRVVDSLLAYQVRMNDRIDFANAGRSDIADLRSESVRLEAEAKSKLDSDLTKLNSPETKILIESAIKEVEVVESYIASRRMQLSFDDVEKYRNVVNAVSNCVVTAAVLGPQFLPGRLETLPQERLNWQGIYDKYKWAFGSEPANNVERTIMIMHNLGMAGQIDDDWFGRHIDEALGIYSYADAALDEKHHNEVEAHEFLDGIRKAYLDQAKRLGLSPMGIKMIDGVQRRLQKTMNWFTRKARFSQNPKVQHFIREKVTTKMGVREKAFAEGKL